MTMVVSYNVNQRLCLTEMGRSPFSVLKSGDLAQLGLISFPSKIRHPAE